jgi:large subunit ribosomal protein L15
MVERKRRKKNKVRGERTHSKGGTKNSRGAGTRGGRGNAGSNKHKFHSLNRVKPIKYRLKTQGKKVVITLGSLSGMIDKLLEKGKVIEENGMIVVGPKSGYTKILSQGNTSRKLLVKIDSSKEAAEKIRDAGGKIEFKRKGSEDDLDDDDFEVDESEGVEE